MRLKDKFIGTESVCYLLVFFSDILRHDQRVHDSKCLSTCSCDTFNIKRGCNPVWQKCLSYSYFCCMIEWTQFVYASKVLIDLLEKSENVTR